jgi:hypothetical protein
VCPAGPRKRCARSCKTPPRAEMEALRPPSAAVVSLLRIDVAIWIHHSHSRAASRARWDRGIPEPGHSHAYRRDRACRPAGDLV